MKVKNLYLLNVTVLYAMPYQQGTKDMEYPIELDPQRLNVII